MGTDSDEHTGRLIQEYFQKMIRTNLGMGILNMYETSDFFRVKQKVFVLAGSDRDFTKVAVDQYISKSSQGLLINR